MKKTLACAYYIVCFSQCLKIAYEDLKVHTQTQSYGHLNLYYRLENSCPGKKTVQHFYRISCKLFSIVRHNICRGWRQLFLNNVYLNISFVLWKEYCSIKKKQLKWANISRGFCFSEYLPCEKQLLYREQFESGSLHICTDKLDLISHAEIPILPVD